MWVIAKRVTKVETNPVCTHHQGEAASKGNQKNLKPVGSEQLEERKV